MWPSASVIRHWGLFFDFTKRSHFPLTKGAVLARPSFSAPGRTHAVYAVHLEGARRFLGIDFPWRAKAATTATLGLSKAGGQSFTPGTAITKGELAQIILQRRFRPSSCSQLDVSPTSPCTVGRADENLTPEDRRPERAASGVVNRKLITKLRKRKHMIAGS